MALSDFTVEAVSQSIVENLRTRLAPLRMFASRFLLENKNDVVKVALYGASSGGARTKTTGDSFVLDAEAPTKVEVSATTDTYVSLNVEDEDLLNADRTRAIEQIGLQKSYDLAKTIYDAVIGYFTAAAVVPTALNKDFSTMDGDDLVEVAKAAREAGYGPNAVALFNTNGWAAFMKDGAILNPESLPDEVRRRMIDGVIQRQFGLNLAFPEYFPDNSEQLGGLLARPDAAAIAGSPYRVPERNNYVEVQRFDDPDDAMPNAEGGEGGTGISVTLLRTHLQLEAESGWIWVTRWGGKLLDATKAKRLVDTSL